MKCMYCQGIMERKTAPFNINRKGYAITWNAIPAWVCEQCGEFYFESKEVDKIQKALLLLEQETAELTVSIIQIIYGKESLQRLTHFRMESHGIPGEIQIT